MWSDAPESCAGSGVATGRVSHARHVKGEDPDKKGYPGSPGWGLGMGLPHHIKKYCFKTSCQASYKGKEYNMLMAIAKTIGHELGCMKCRLFI